MSKQVTVATQPGDARDPVQARADLNPDYADSQRTVSEQRPLSGCSGFCCLRGTGGVHSADLADDALDVFQAPASPLATIIPAPLPVSTQVNFVDSHLHPYQGSLSLS
jgi:hypothetical protein